MISAFAHDLRTPLTVMKGHLDLLETEFQRWPAPPADVESSIGYLRDSLESMEHYIDTMRELRRLDDWPVKRAPVGVPTYVDRIAATYSALAGDLGKEFGVVCTVHGSVEFDTALLDCVLANVIENALRHARRRVQVTFSDGGEAGCIGAGSDSSAVHGSTPAALVVEVVDDGRGFSRKALSHALEPFFRDEARTDAAHHSGLGLTIAEALVKRHGGSIAIANMIANPEECADVVSGARVSLEIV